MPAVPGSPRPVLGAVKPTWWWFMVHGLMVMVFGVITLATPLSDEHGFLIDTGWLAALCMLVGVQAALQATTSPTFAQGWWVLFAIGMHCFGAGIAFAILTGLALPYALFWSIVSFLSVNGLLLAIGLAWSPVYRMWGVLMGTCLIIAAAMLTAAWLLDPSHSFDIPDAGMGIAALLYGSAVFVAAMQARVVSLRSAGPGR